MKNYLWSSLALLVAIMLIFTPGALAQTEEQPVVHAVLFFSPTCPHCHDVINNLLVPMIEEHGDRLQVMGVDVTQEDGQTMYQMAIEQYQIPPNRLGVPTLIVADRVLVGSVEIPGQFPQIVAEGLAGGGIDWPAIPGLAEALPPPTPAEESAAPAEATPPDTVTAAPDSAAAEPAPPTAAPTASAGQPSPTAAATAQAAVPPETEPEPPAESAVITLSENNVPQVAAAETAPPPDPIGIGLAGLVLGAMLFALYFTARALSLNSHRLLELSRTASGSAGGWLIPLLALLGLGVSGYLAYVEITHTEAICGPVGNCNAVQSSPYAAIAGVPVAVLGLLNYVAVLALWLGVRFGRGQVADLSLLGLLALGLVGVVFSVYLTGLEIFVIRAVCAWCISSAIITTAILLIAATSIYAPAPGRPAPA
ncbi:MAG: hypothetical protein Kow0031_30820 [Anaerolineae bacterium]